MPISSEAVLALSVVLGIAVPPLSGLLGPGLYPFVFFLMVFSLMGIPVRHALPDRVASARLVKMLAWQLVALPIAAGLWHRFMPGAGAGSALVLITACAGTIFGAPAFARVMRLDTTLTLQGVLAGTLLMPVVLPVLVGWFTSGNSEFDFGAYAWRLCIFIAIPLLIAATYQRRTDPERGYANSLWNTLTIAFLALFGIAVMDGIGARILAQPWQMLELFGLALGVHIAFFALSVVLFLGQGQRAALTAGLLSGYRNMALILAVGGDLLPPDFQVFVALWQIPMFVAPYIVRQATRWRTPGA